MKRRTLARIGIGAALCLPSGMLMVGSTIGTASSANPGPTGCVAQTNNGAIAAGTLVDGFSQPGTSQPGATCTFTEPTGTTGGGIGGGDSAGWSVTLSVKPGAGTPACTGTQNADGTWTIKGTGQAACGFGTIPAGASVTVTAG